VFDNLVKNALEAMQETVSEARLSISSGRDAQSVYVSVSDTGTGINADDSAKIFEPFFTKKASGSGLGLTLAAQVITAHGGIITWHACEPQGTCFVITIPVAP
jgi:signal transduction histidine kinase